MAMGSPKGTLVLDAEPHVQLESLANSRALPAGLVRRAKIILLSASEKTNREIARQVETSKNTVSLWRQRFLVHEVPGLYEELDRAGHAHQRRTCGAISSQDAEGETQGQHALEYSANCR